MLNLRWLHISKTSVALQTILFFSDLPTEPKEEPPAIQAHVQYANGETEHIFQDEGQSVMDYLDHVRTIVNLFSKEDWFSKS